MGLGFTGRLLLITLASLSAVVPAVAQEVYVPNYLDGDVSVLDARTLAPLARIPVTSIADPSISVTGEPSSVAFSLDHRFAFVVISNSDRVAVIDTQQRTVIQYLVIAPVTFDALIFRHPDGQRLYVTSCADPVISVIDIDSQTTIGTIPLPGGSYAMAFVGNGATAYIASGYSGCGDLPGLYRFDTVTNTVTSFLPLSQAPSDVAIAPGGLFALTTGGDRILVVNLVTGTEAGAVKCGLVPCAYTSTGAIVFNNTGTRAYTVDSVTNEFITIDTDPKSRGLLQQLSKVSIPVPPGTTFWQLAIRKSYAYVAANGWGADGVVVKLDISRDIPVAVSTEAVGDFGYELTIWAYPTSKQQCEGDGWMRFGTFDGRGACISSVVNHDSYSRW
jgi:DNA-binding beta-propeller fold protein YncE